MTKKRIMLAAVAALFLGVAGWYFYGRESGTVATGNKQAPKQEPIALVKTLPLRKQALPVQLIAYGEVMAGKIEGISFPRAGQIARLLVTPGQQVRQGTPLATLNSDPNAQMAYAQAANAVKYAQGELERIRELYDLQLATQSQVGNANKALQDAKANLAAQQKLGGNVGSATVTAPFSGVVLALSVAQGDRIQPGGTILQLGRTDALRVQLGVEPGDAHLVKAGMPVTLSPVQSDEQKVQAAVSLLHGLVDPKTQLINALVILQGRATRFMVPGMRVRATIHAGQHDAWTVPRQAVLTDDQGDYIFQVADGRARRVKVTRIQESRDLAAINGPVTPGQPVVVLGNYELQDGMNVREGAR